MLKIYLKIQLCVIIVKKKYVFIKKYAFKRLPHIPKKGTCESLFVNKNNTLRLSHILVFLGQYA